MTFLASFEEALSSDNLLSQNTHNPQNPYSGDGKKSFGDIGDIGHRPSSEKMRSDVSSPSEPDRKEADLKSSANAIPSLAGGEKPRRCILCASWQKASTSCWWLGVCATTGGKVGFRSVCTLPGMEVAA